MHSVLFDQKLTFFAIVVQLLHAEIIVVFADSSAQRKVGISEHHCASK